MGNGIIQAVYNYILYTRRVNTSIHLTVEKVMK